MAEELIISEDLSPTLYSQDFNAHYHSLHGAMTETMVVFIDAGLNFKLKEKAHINILEIGFGTGLNAFATLLNLPMDAEINYVTLEKFPLSGEITDDFIGKLNLDQQAIALYQAIHACPWGDFQKIVPSFNLKKIRVDFLEFRTNSFFDLIYFDAFAPDTQPELWDGEMFGYLYERLVNGGVLTTYCAKGIVKRKLKEIGFIIESLPGPPGKREITRAIKQS